MVKSRSVATSLAQRDVIHAHGQLGSTKNSTSVMSGGFCRHFVQSLCQGDPTERGALDAHRELHHTLERGELTELVEIDDVWLLVLAVLAEMRFVDRHHRLAGVDELMLLIRRLALDGGRHQGSRGLADRAPGATDLEIRKLAVFDQKAEDALVAAQRVEALDPMGWRRFELAPVTGRAVVVKDDLAIEIVEVAHQQASGARDVTRTIYRLPPNPQSTLRCRVRR